MTPNASSIISERRNPGVSATALAPYAATSWPWEKARRPTRRGQVVEHGDAVGGGVVGDGPVGDLDHESSRLLDEQREEVVRRDEVRVDGQAQHAQTFVEIHLPEGPTPVRRVPGEGLRAPMSLTNT